MRFMREDHRKLSPTCLGPWQRFDEANPPNYGVGGGDSLGLLANRSVTPAMHAGQLFCLVSHARAPLRPLPNCSLIQQCRILGHGAFRAARRVEAERPAATKRRLEYSSCSELQRCCGALLGTQTKHTLCDAVQKALWG
jgi:hypothetical protein